MWTLRTLCAHRRTLWWARRSLGWLGCWALNACAVQVLRHMDGHRSRQHCVLREDIPVHRSSHGPHTPTDHRLRAEPGNHAEPQYADVVLAFHAAQGGVAHGSCCPGDKRRCGRRRRPCFGTRTPTRHAGMLFVRFSRRRESEARCVFSRRADTGSGV